MTEILTHEQICFIETALNMMAEQLYKDGNNTACIDMRELEQKFKDMRDTIEFAKNRNEIELMAQISLILG